MSLSQLLFFRKKGEPMTFEDAYFKKKVLKPDSLEPFGLQLPSKAMSSENH